MSDEALIKWNKLFCSNSEYIEDCHGKWMKKYGHCVDEEEGVSSEYEEPGEGSE